MRHQRIPSTAIHDRMCQRLTASGAASRYRQHAAQHRVVHIQRHVCDTIQDLLPNNRS